MKYTCPKCGYVGDTKAVKDAAAQELNALYARFGLEEKLAREYLNRFLPPSGRDMHNAKERRLLEELLAIWESGYFERSRRGFQVSREMVRDAMRIVCDNQVDPKTHGYLLAILQRKAVQVERVAEREKHEKAEARLRKPGQGMTPMKEAMKPFDFEEAKKNARKAREKVFGKKED